MHASGIDLGIMQSSGRGGADSASDTPFIAWRRGNVAGPVGKHGLAGLDTFDHDDNDSEDEDNFGYADGSSMSCAAFVITGSKSRSVKIMDYDQRSRRR